MRNSKLHLFMAALTFAVLAIVAVPKAAEAGCTEGATRNHTHSCCGLNNKQHSWELCHNNQWFSTGYCDYNDCCAYPCGVAASGATTRSFLSFTTGDSLSQLLGDTDDDGCKAQTVKDLLGIVNADEEDENVIPESETQVMTWPQAATPSS